METEIDKIDEASDSEADEAEAFRFVPVCQSHAPKEGECHSLEDAIQKDRILHQFDLLRLVGHILSGPTERGHGLNENIHTFDDEANDDSAHFYDIIQCINFCRQRVIERRKEVLWEHDKAIGPEIEDAYVQFWHEKESSQDQIQKEDQYFAPVLDDDSLLFHTDDLFRMARDKLGEDGGDHVLENDAGASEVNISSYREDLESKRYNEVERLKSEVMHLKDQLHMTRNFISTLTNDDSNEKQSEENSSDQKKIDVDSYYFEGYSHYSIHETMLRDKVRTDSYRRAIMENRESLFRDKVVLDVGCGTGILSLFAAKAGAKKVIAVDNSAEILDLARKLSVRNGMSDKIYFVKGKVETLVENTIKHNESKKYSDRRVAGVEAKESVSVLPLNYDEKIDVIVSEWMGYALFFETMLPSVMCARDTFMLSAKNGGTMFPNATRIYIEGASDGGKGGLYEQWKDIYGFDYSDMAQVMAIELTTQALVETVQEKDVVTSRALLVQHDLNSCLDEDLDFFVPFLLTPRRNKARVDKLVLSFDVDFNFSKCTCPVSFSTGCGSEPTHWKQTSLYIEPITAPTLEEGETMEGNFQMSRNKMNHRELDFTVEWCVRTSDGSERCDGSIKSALKA